MNSVGHVEKPHLSRVKLVDMGPTTSRRITQCNVEVAGNLEVNRRVRWQLDSAPVSHRPC